MGISVMGLKTKECLWRRSRRRMRVAKQEGDGEVRANLLCTQILVLCTQIPALCTPTMVLALRNFLCQNFTQILVSRSWMGPQEGPPRDLVILGCILPSPKSTQTQILT